MRQNDLIIEPRQGQGTSVQQTIVEVSPRVPLLAAGAFALGLAVGTGGAATGPTIAELVRNLQSTTVSWQCLTPARRSGEEALTLAEQVLTIQQTLSLTLSELSSVLKVSRPTVYKWLRKEATPHAQNVARIGEVFKAMKRWRTYSDERPREHVRSPMVEDQSVVDLLSSDQVDVNKLDTAFAHVCDAMERLRSSGRVVRVIKAVEFPSLPESVKEDNLIGEAGV
jgi:transcriptional regulator with XRE-family HTH domain